MAKVPLADVLWKAANEHLAHDAESDDGDRYGYSCAAIATALGDSAIRGEPRDFICSLGCEPASFTLFSKYAFRFTARTQGLRYLWLLLAMHVAEDEKLMVEVAQ
jgi:hypothetical protein